VIIRGAAAALVALTALVTGCAGPIAGTPRAAVAPTGGGLPLEPEQARLAELFAEVRSWDVCAMHDIEAAARTTGYPSDELLPASGPGGCLLVTTAPTGIGHWELRLDLTPMPPAAGDPVDVAGVQMPQVDGAAGGGKCAYSYPIRPTGQGDEPWGIQLSAVSTFGDKAPCDVAREYATAIAPRLANPPRRSAGGTTPALDIAASDPCAVAAAMVPALADGGSPGPVAVADLEPYKCGVRVDTTSGGAVERRRASIEFALALVPDLGGATIGGFPGARSEAGTECQAQFAPFDTRISGNPGGTAIVPVVNVVGNCDRLDALATAAAGAIAPATTPPPRVDARTLGDVDPPPTAESVGAPFDPCTVAGGWQAYPAEVRPSEPVPGKAVIPGPEDPFVIGCKFNAHGMFSLLVWGTPTPDGFSADPAARAAGAVARQYAGKPGVEETSTNEGNGAPSCYSVVQLSHGIAAISTTLFGDPCRVNRAILEQIARKVP
jgi:hypothetical protein